ncbi:hypothetical protein CBL_01399 [Carabus blaptoides fortunei]
MPKSVKRWNLILKFLKICGECSIQTAHIVDERAGFTEREGLTTTKNPKKWWQREKFGVESVSRYVHSHTYETVCLHGRFTPSISSSPRDKGCTGQLDPCHEHNNWPRIGHESDLIKTHK